jgi:GntR family transcriptional repressor for pyruvate dehydrogenase complex
METAVSAMYDARQRTVELAVDLRQSAEMHRAIYRAIRARDAVGARKAMEQHLLLAESAQVSEAALPSHNGARRRSTNGRQRTGESKRRARAGE